MCLISTAHSSKASAGVSFSASSERDAAKTENPTKLPVSVFIIAKDEAVRLPRCLAALVSWAGEIILVDSGSNDQTVEIAEAFGAKVYHRAWDGYGPQKRFAQEKCRHDWVLNVDADEVVTEDLAAEIKAHFDKMPPEPDAFRMRILTVYPGKTKPRLWANDYNVVRFYHRSIGSNSDDAVHDRVNNAGVMQKLTVERATSLWISRRSARDAANSVVSHEKVSGRRYSACFALVKSGQLTLEVIA